MSTFRVSIQNTEIQVVKLAFYMRINIGHNLQFSSARRVTGVRVLFKLLKIRANASDPHGLLLVVGALSPILELPEKHGWLSFDFIRCYSHSIVFCVHRNGMIRNVEAMPCKHQGEGRGFFPHFKYQLVLRGLLP
jgi:hypothetical protein